MGSKSIWLIRASDSLPFGILAGQRARKGTRCPPSQAPNLKPSSLPFKRCPAFHACCPVTLEHTSVVARKDDERIVRDLELIQGLEHFSHDPVEFMDEVPVRAALTCTLELGMGGEGVMNVGGRQVQEEGFLLSFF